MREPTREFLLRLAQAPLFEAVGRSDGAEGAVMVSSWAQAAKMRNKRKNENIEIMAANDIRGQLPYERLQTWNGTVDVVRAEVAPIVQARVEGLDLPPALRRAVGDVARWDLLHAGMEHEFGDVVTTRFYRDLAEWYFRGHFVCGWDRTEDGLVTIVY